MKTTELPKFLYDDERGIIRIGYLDDMDVTKEWKAWLDRWYYEKQNTMKTAKELLSDNFLLIENGKTCEAHTHLVVEQMIVFAKLHVKAALEAAAENVKVLYIEEDGCATGDYYDVDKDSILNIYPEKNIK